MVGIFFPSHNNPCLDVFLILPKRHNSRCWYFIFFFLLAVAFMIAIVDLILFAQNPQQMDGSENG